MTANSTSWHGWEDFYVGEDIDNLDFDDEIEAPAKPEFEAEIENTDSDALYCQCKMPETGEMVECNGTACPGNNWFHFNCIGITEKEVPAGDWFCSSCNISLNGHTNRTPTPIGAVTEENVRDDDAPKKKRQRTQKVPLKRTQRYTKGDALQKGREYITEILRSVSNHPLFSHPSRIVTLVLSLSTLLLAASESEAFLQFCAYLTAGLWDVVTAGDKKPLTYAETLVINFHAFTISDELLSKWDTLLESLQIEYGQIESDCILQHILDMLLEKLITERNSVDVPILEEMIKATDMNTNEEQVLSYVAGYIPFAMIKHYKKSKNEIAQKYVETLRKWSIDDSYHGQFSFLEYTTKWIEAQSRGKLFKPHPRLFLLFRAAENETRKHLNTALIGKYRDINIRELLMQKLSTNYLVQLYWSKLVKNDLSCAESKHLFKVAINYFVNLRIRAFVIVYVDLRKIQDKNLSKKGTKGLRQQLCRN